MISRLAYQRRAIQFVRFVVSSSSLRHTACMDGSTRHVNVRSASVYTNSYQLADPCVGRGQSPLPPARGPEKYFFKVIENKFNDRKLMLITWYSRKRCWHYTDCVNTAASGGLRPQTLSGDSAPCTPTGCTVHRPLPRPPTLVRPSGSATDAY